MVTAPLLDDSGVVGVLQVAAPLDPLEASLAQLRLLLGIESRYELDGFLKEHNVYDYTVEDFEHDLATIRKLENKRQSDRT